jgi:hypothetical protein
VLWAVSKAQTTTAILGKGYYQTIFTSHAPTVTERLGDFDSEFEELLADRRIDRRESRRKAIEVITAELDKLQPNRNCGTDPGLSTYTTANTLDSAHHEQSSVKAVTR